MSLSVGSDIEAWCGKCGDVWHVVAAKVGDQIVKVVCKRCQGQHRYKAPPGKEGANTPALGLSVTAPAIKAPPKKRVTRPRGSKIRVDEPTVKPDLSKPPRVYAAKDTYRKGQQVTHPSFGTGVVEGSPGPNKVTIFFPIGRKVLVMGKTPV